jgi:hypothetical protein
MQVITSGRRPARTGVATLVFGTVLGTVLVAAGMTIAYLAFATPFMDRIIPSGRPTEVQTFVGLVVWSFALVGPALFVLLGANRLANVLSHIGRRARPYLSPAARSVGALPADLVVALDVDPGDGRRIPELVVGPFGVAVIRELPPATVTRHSSGAWEVRTRDGWLSIENPLERASRDAERVRRWLAHDDHDFVVKVHAAVVGTDPEVARTPNCAVIAMDQMPAWLASLPAQRSLTESRRERLLEMVRAAV